MNFIKTWEKDRDEALKSLDIEKIRKYCLKYKIPMPKDEIVILAGAHKARLHMLTTTEEEKEISKKWLKEHNFKETIF